MARPAEGLLPVGGVTEVVRHRSGINAPSTALALTLLSGMKRSADERDGYEILVAEIEVSPRPLATGAAIAAVSRIGVTAAGAATTIVLARVLGPHGWGAYAVAQSLLLTLVAGTTLGVEHGIAYFVSAGQWAAHRAFASAMKSAILVGTIGAAVGLSVRVLFPSAFAGLQVWLTAVVLVGLPFALALLYTSYIALATDKYEAAMSLPALQATLVFALAVPGAVLAGVKGAVVGMTLAGVFAGITGLAWGLRRLPRTETSKERLFRRAVSFGVKGYASNALQLINYRLDLFILAAVASTAVVGRYALAAAATALLWVLPRALADVVYPRVARLSEADEQSMRESWRSRPFDTRVLSWASALVFSRVRWSS